MIQANACPIAPSLGCEWYVPEPETRGVSQDGITSGAWNRTYSKQFKTVVGDIYVALVNYTLGGYAVTLT